MDFWNVRTKEVPTTGRATLFLVLRSLRWHWIVQNKRQELIIEISSRAQKWKSRNEHE